MKPKTQLALILERLELVGWIDPLYAMKYFNCFRLAAQIHILRGRGHDITTTLVNNRKNAGQHAVYLLEGV